LLLTILIKSLDNPPASSFLDSSRKDNIEFSIFLPAGFGVIPLTWLYYF